MNEEALIEALAALEHEQWVDWSKNVAENEFLTIQRRDRWEKMWVPYADLPEEVKEQDRIWARKVLETMIRSGDVKASAPRRMNPGQSPVVENENETCAEVDTKERISVNLKQEVKAPAPNEYDQDRHPITIRAKGAEAVNEHPTPLDIKPDIVGGLTMEGEGSR